MLDQPVADELRSGGARGKGAVSEVTSAAKEGDLRAAADVGRVTDRRLVDRRVR